MKNKDSRETAPAPVRTRSGAYVKDEKKPKSLRRLLRCGDFGLWQEGTKALVAGP